MSLNKIIKSIPEKLIKEGKTFINKVREFEETEKGNFIAFVDDGNASYDVNIVLTDKSDSVEKTSCDCNITSAFCPHKIAVLLYMKSGSLKEKESTTLKKIRKKKLSPTEELIDSLDHTQLRNWLLAELEKNNELSFKFKFHFSSDNGLPSLEDVKKYGEETIKAVIKNKKYIEPSEVRDILDIWNTYMNTHIESIFKLYPTPEGKKYFHVIDKFHNELSRRLKRFTPRVETNLAKWKGKINSYISTVQENDTSNKHNT